MTRRHQRGSVLVGVLWCLVVLAVVVVGVLHHARLGLLLARHHGDDVQARFLAIAGIEKAKALLAQDFRDRKRAGRAHFGSLANDPAQLKDVALGIGRFSVLRPGLPAEGGGWIHGIGDEEARLNVNVAGTNELLRLPGMTPDAAAGILDWRDADDVVSPGGAEIAHYASLVPPVRPRNAPFQTVRELLAVRGVERAMLDGRTAPGTAARDGGSADPDLRAAGWRDVLTVNSGVANVSASGKDRVNVRTADEKDLAAVTGFNQEIARAIVARRNGNRLENLLDLLDVTPAPRAGALGPNGLPVNPGNAQPDPNGPRLVSEDALIAAADELTAEDRETLDGVINVNTAGIDVLMCLPGIDRTLAQAIVNHRASSGFLAHPVALLRVPGMTRDLLRPILPRLAARSETFRILAEGTIPGRDTRRRIEAVVRIGTKDPLTLSWREDDL